MSFAIARSSLVVVVLFAALCSYSQDHPDDPTAARRARHLSHGINASEWFAQSNDYSAGRLNTYTTKEDIALIKQMGFDHVRLSLDPAIFACLSDKRDCDRLQILDGIVSRCLELDLAVIIDIHPTSEFKHSLAADDSAVSRFADLWRAIALHFRDKDPERVFFEVMNEPEMYDAYRWSAVQQKALVAIRRSAPKHTVIVAGSHWSDIEDLIVMEPYADANVIYNFHFYEPHIFTHQGATWGEYFWRSLSKVPYPATPESIITRYNRWMNLSVGA